MRAEEICVELGMLRLGHKWNTQCHSTVVGCGVDHGAVQPQHVPWTWSSGICTTQSY